MAPQPSKGPSSNLQIPPADAAPSRHHHSSIPVPSSSSSNNHRQTGGTPQQQSSSSSSRRQQRATYTITSTMPQGDREHLSNNNGNTHQGSASHHQGSSSRQGYDDNGNQHSQHPQQQQRSHHHSTSRDYHLSPSGDVYNHPAVQAYVSAHPRRTIPKFGDYLLLQTLGEGEFGKVKLGVHTVWGEEVAVKLIRRVSVDNNLRMSKVGREIEVLKTLKHPNIVRLYDVIETDKYVGIILEYASGGELFDHILAHRYLKERDAAKLFSQLISGVWYIHQKKIVHRDLKLENLLLDKNRNVIITDFGFANRFEHRTDDLMQTSCGSPCYAAPELVISEGSYVGSAVDIWSCGVILYAMLAGYLPFDDDPANPDGDNINLLYRYIVSTPLSFPDYISAQARDILGMMLVPDPTKRASLQAVMVHPWLSGYQQPSAAEDDTPHAFGRTVDELEKACLEQQEQRRMAYQKQMRAQGRHHQGGAGAAGPTHHTSVQPESTTARAARSQSHRPEATMGSAATKRKEDVSYFETPIDQSHSYAGAHPMAHSNTSPATAALVAATSAAKKGSSPLVIGDDDPFAAAPGKSQAIVNLVPPSQVSNNNTLPVPSVSTPPVATSSKQKDRAAGSKEATPGGLTVEDEAKKQHKPGGGGPFRHTIQVEYNAPQDGRAGSRRESEDRSRKDKEKAHPMPAQQSANGNGAPPTSAPNSGRRSSQTTKPLPASPPGSSETSTIPFQQAAPPASALPDKSSTSTSKVHKVPGIATAPMSPPPAVPSSISAQPNRPMPIATSPQINVSSPPATPTQFQAPQQGSDGERGSQSSAASAKGHKKGRSSLDRIGLGKIFGGGGSSSTAHGNGGAPAELNTNDHRDRDRGSEASGANSASSSVLLPPSSTPTQEKEKEGKKSRRNTLTVVVAPIARTVRGKGKDKKAATPIHGDAGASHPLPSNPGMNGSVSSVVAPSGPNPPFTGVGAGAGGVNGMQASTSKAKKVMEWFRSKSKTRGGDVSVDFDETGNLTSPIGPQANNSSLGLANAAPDHQQGSPFRAPTSGGTYHGRSATTSGGPTSAATTPSTARTFGSLNGNSSSPVQVVVTSAPGTFANSGSPPSAQQVFSPFGSVGRHVSLATAAAPNAPGHPLRTASVATDQSIVSTTHSPSPPPQPASAPQPPSTQSLVTRFRNSITTSTGYGGSRGHQSGAAQNPGGQLRVHHGAVDQTTITTGQPPEVMKHVREVLGGMGVEIHVESDYKYRCIRPKRKKGQAAIVVAAANAVMNSANGGPGNTSPNSANGQDAFAAVAMSGSAGSSGVDRRGLPLPSPSPFSSTGGMLRGLWSRRQSSQVSTTSSRHANFGDVGNPSNLLEDDSVLVAEPGAMVEPAFGDPTQDAGDEVRFSVELTRLDRLNDTYSLDIRRLKGNLRSYKFLYDTLRQRANLQR